MGVVKNVLAGLGVLFVGGTCMAMSSNSTSSTTTSASSTAVHSTEPPATPPEPPTPGAQWSYSSSTDEMTGKSSYQASVASTNTIELDFPYQGAQNGTLILRKHPRHGSDVIFRIERGQLLCTSYEGCNVLVRFDDEEPSNFSAAGPDDNSSEVLFIRNYARFVAKVQKAKTVRIAPKIYQAGGVVFEFDVSGFSSNKFLGKE